MGFSSVVVWVFWVVEVVCVDGRMVAYDFGLVNDDACMGFLL